MQDSSKAELEGVTFTGRTDLAATKDAPAISMSRWHQAFGVGRNATARLKGTQLCDMYMAPALFKELEWDRGWHVSAHQQGIDWHQDWHRRWDIDPDRMLRGTFPL
jgi:hypothetical protein